MTPLQGLKALRKLLADPKHWTQRVYAKDAKGNGLADPVSPSATCWCILGGLRKVTSDEAVAIEVRREVRYQMVKALANDGMTPYLIDFNDKRGRTHAEVLELIDKGIASLSKRKG